MSGSSLGLGCTRSAVSLRVPGRSFRIDLAYPAQKLAIELDGWDFHRTRTAFDDDRSRANALVLDRWALLRFTSRSTDAEVSGP